jgi:hypothetical protein
MFVVVASPPKVPIVLGRGAARYHVGHAGGIVLGVRRHG